MGFFLAFFRFLKGSTTLHFPNFRKHLVLHTVSKFQIMMQKFVIFGHILKISTSVVLRYYLSTVIFVSNVLFLLPTFKTYKKTSAFDFVSLGNERNMKNNRKEIIRVIIKLIIKCFPFFHYKQI